MVFAVVAVVGKKDAVMRCGGCHISTVFFGLFGLNRWGGSGCYHILQLRWHNSHG